MSQESHRPMAHKVYFNGMPGRPIDLSNLRLPTSEFNRSLVEQAHNILGYHDSKNAKVTSAVEFMMSLDRFRNLPGYGRIEDSEVKPNLVLWADTLHDDLREKTQKLISAKSRSERVQDLRAIYGIVKSLAEQGRYHVSWQEVVHRKRQMENAAKQERSIRGRIHANPILSRRYASRSVI